MPLSERYKEIPVHAKSSPTQSMRHLPPASSPHSRRSRKSDRNAGSPARRQRTAESSSKPPILASLPRDSAVTFAFRDIRSRLSEAQPASASIPPDPTRLCMLRSNSEQLVAPRRDHRQPPVVQRVASPSNSERSFRAHAALSTNATTPSLEAVVPRRSSCMRSGHRRETPCSTASFAARFAPDSTPPIPPSRLRRSWSIRLLRHHRARARRRSASRDRARRSPRARRDRADAGCDTLGRASQSLRSRRRFEDSSD